MAPKKKPKPDGIRDRIKEFRRVPSAELEDNDKNWRTHPFAQTAAMAEILESIGIAGALLAYYSDRNGGKLTLIDGHERKGNHDAEWPTLILDVNDDEADKLLATYDPLSAMAEANTTKLTELLATVKTEGPALTNMLHRLSIENKEKGPKPEPGDPLGGPPEMELQPFEHYDYVMLLAKNSHDWLSLVDLFDIKPVKFTLKDGKRKKFGRGRVIDAGVALAMLRPPKK